MIAPESPSPSATTTTLVAPPPLVVVWRVTERCNLACAFCACARDLPHARRESDPAAVRAFLAVLAAHARATGRRVLVSWLGGEPLRWAPLTALTTHATRDLGLRVSTTTNGTTLHAAAVRAHLLAHYTELTVSIDGFADFHDRIRGWRDGFGALQRDLAALVAEKHALGRGPRLRANIVVMRDNLAAFAPLCRELATWGFDEITFNQLGGLDRPEFFPAHRLRPADVARFAAGLPALRAELAARGVTLAGGAGYLHRMAASARDAALPVTDCAPGARFLFVEADGRAAPCSFTVADYGIPIADLRSAADVAALPFHFAAARATHRARSCADCHSTQVFEKFSATRSPAVAPAAARALSATS